jgi:hypothetical protein
VIFLFFAAGVATAFFVGSLLSLHLGRYLGLKYREHAAINAAAGLATVEGSIFGLMGLLLAFTWPRRSIARGYRDAYEAASKR